MLELLAENVKATSGKKAPVSGVYRSGSEYIPLTMGERFPPTVDGHWSLVVNLGSKSIDELGI